MGIFVDITGQKFGKLTVMGLADIGAGRTTKFLCQCDCMNFSIVNKQNLVRGLSKSCGCTFKGKVTHGTGHTLEYRAWTGMIQRCYNPNATNFENYGGRGITVCKRWRYGEHGKSGFACFFEDMGPKQDGQSLDRKKNDKGYSPSNCRWANDTTQNGNRRGCIYVEVAKEKITVAELSRRTGVKYTTIRARLKRGLSVSAAVSTFQ